MLTGNSRIADKPTQSAVREWATTSSGQSQFHARNSEARVIALIYWR